MESFANLAAIVVNRKNVRNSQDVCKSPKEAPKFEWLHKYRKASKGQGGVKQTLAPLGTTHTKISQHKKTRNSLNAVSRSPVEGDKRVEQPRVESSPESQGKVKREGWNELKREGRDDLVRHSSHTASNKATMLAMPQFGLRDNLIRCELLKNEDIYTYLENFSFFLGTYNVNGQTPKETLRPWLGSTSTPPDMYCVGFQELDLSKEAFFFNDTPKETEWMKAVSEGLHPDAKYALVKLVRLVGIMLLFYVKNEHAKHISEMEAETVGTGIMGRMGNKGAVAIRFRFHNSDICVVNSHLAAHIEEYERRNQDYKDICSRLLFHQNDPAMAPLTILKHNVVLWLGDLNYRLSDLDIDHVKDLIAKKDFETLHSYDQLKRQIDEEAVFVGFVEGEICFLPTYKYDTGSDQWDTSEKCRVPAWCDRILWRGKNVRQLHYQSHMALKTSDHKPVSSLLEIGIKLVNEESYKKTFEEIVRSLDKMENECIPSVILSRREFHFKDVKFMQHQAERLTLHNDGQVPCQFEFIEKLDEPTYCKPWLTANPAKGFIAQGGNMDIDLEVFVNRSTATELNAGRQQIEDILVLHLERGKDYFLSVSGNYLPSCFGSSIQTLCQLRDPIQEIPLETIRELTLSGDETSTLIIDKPLDIPKEIWQMVDHLYRNAPKQGELFQQPGLRSEFVEIRDCLDTGMPDSLPGSNHSVAEALLLFLDALPEPVVPFSLYQQCLECCSNTSQCKKVVSSLPRCHKNVFNYIAAFLRELLKHSTHNSLDVNILATIFAALLLRSPTKQDLAEKRKTQEFFEHFLVQDLS
ncbi:type II inositol 1,4,5-trisphosphate 5-phosphatase isoform X1 [Coregonus clupeaformis]|uniref:type II inositol 1,4,5-trisphosphate 5-phosphatase isoform X1 n=1 Tax=Coregonus clupeaformis TaxID=59861 RepID=UPI001E1C3E23|nr:type II inositol 1,4,5-trisphosphate 5-phosphatase isoform X1 [Coregonus clupeaformis]